MNRSPNERQPRQTDRRIVVGEVHAVFLRAAHKIMDSSKSCNNPLTAQFRARQKPDVSGTPAILLDDGRLLPGYVPPRDLARLLNQPADGVSSGRSRFR